MDQPKDHSLFGIGLPGYYTYNIINRLSTRAFFWGELERRQHDLATKDIGY